MISGLNPEKVNLMLKYNYYTMYSYALGFDQNSKALGGKRMPWIANKQVPLRISKWRFR